MNTAVTVAELVDRLRMSADMGNDPVSMLWSAVTDRSVTFQVAAEVAARAFGDTEPAEAEYLAWLGSVDCLMTTEHGFGIMDGNDVDYHGWFLRGVSPAAAVVRAVGGSVVDHG